MSVRRTQFLASVVLGLLALVGTLALLGAWDGGPRMVYAQSGTGVIRVATTGTDAVDWVVSSRRARQCNTPWT